MNDAEKLARIFKLLSVDTRVQMIDLLKQRCLCVNALASRLKITPAAVSQHVRILRDAEIVIADKRGNFVHYCVNKEVVARWHKAAEGLLESDGAKG